LTGTLLISVSQVPRITGMSHQRAEIVCYFSELSSIACHLDHLDALWSISSLRILFQLL
jgi:hypothetical protein